MLSFIPNCTSTNIIRQKKTTIKQTNNAHYTIDRIGQKTNRNFKGTYCWTKYIIDYNQSTSSKIEYKHSH